MIYRLEQQVESNATFKIDVHTFNKVYTQREKVEKIDKLCLAIQFDPSVSVCLDESLVQHRFVYFEEWIGEMRGNGQKTLKRCYFGKFVRDFRSGLS